MALYAFILFGVGNILTILRQSTVALLCLMGGCIIAYITGYMTVMGLCGVFGVWGLSRGFRDDHLKLSRWGWWAVFAATLLAFINLSLHEYPGFTNILFYDQVFISDASKPYSMFLNFDKVTMGLALAIGAGVFMQEKMPDLTALKNTALILGACCLAILGPSLVSGYVRVDIKVPSIGLIWGLNNLIFVCFAQEVLYRGFLQKHLQEKFKQWNRSPLWGLVISSIVFGLEHYKGGMLYVLLAIIAGLFYGYAYYKTGRVTMAILVHFGLNLVHFIFFTYPAATS